eukprot:scaffold102263_cov39-Prasinocladus_malaysianus.AAC.1
MPAFEHHVDEWRSWSPLQTATVATVTLLATTSIVWHMLQAFRRSALVGAVFSLIRLVILAVYLAAILTVAKD